MPEDIKPIIESDEFRETFNFVVAAIENLKKVRPNLTNTLQLVSLWFIWGGSDALKRRVRPSTNSLCGISII